MGGYYKHYNGSNMICQEHLWGEGTAMFSLIWGISELINETQHFKMGFVKFKCFIDVRK